MTVTSVMSTCQLLCRLSLPLTLSDGVSSRLDSGHALWVAHWDMWCDAPVAGAVHIGCLWAKGCPWAVSLALWLFSLFCGECDPIGTVGPWVKQSWFQHLPEVWTSAFYQFGQSTYFSDLVKERLQSSLLGQFEVDELSHVKCSAPAWAHRRRCRASINYSYHLCSNPQARKADLSTGSWLTHSQSVQWIVTEHLRLRRCGRDLEILMEGNSSKGPCQWAQRGVARGRSEFLLKGREPWERKWTN